MERVTIFIQQNMSSPALRAFGAAIGVVLVLSGAGYYWYTNRIVTSEQTRALGDGVGLLPDATSLNGAQPPSGNFPPLEPLPNSNVNSGVKIQVPPQGPTNPPTVGPTVPPSTSTTTTVSVTRTFPQLLSGCSATSTNEQCLCPSSTQPPPSGGRHRLAILVPFRDGCSPTPDPNGVRNKNLAEFVPFMRKFLGQQNVDHRIILVEQVKRGGFNRGLLFNLGYLLAQHSYDYLAIHDVDLVPESADNKYPFPETAPLHLCVAHSQFDYKVMYSGYVGGVLLIRTDHFFAINGFANTYWGWGAEDDDLYQRIAGVLGVAPVRPTPEVGRYRMLQHTRFNSAFDPSYNKRVQDLHAIEAAGRAGNEAITKHTMANGIRQIQYKIVERGCREDYDHYVIDYLNPDVPMGPC